MSGNAREKHRKKTSKAKQSQDSTPEQSVRDAPTSIVITHTSYSSIPGLYPPSKATTIISKGPWTFSFLCEYSKSQANVSGGLSCLETEKENVWTLGLGSPYQDSLTQEGRAGKNDESPFHSVTLWGPTRAANSNPSL